MTAEISVNYDSLRKAYLFSNTPSYLLRHFRGDQSVMHLSKSHTTQELIGLFDKIVKNQVDNIDQMVTLYALLIALTFKEDKLAVEFFAGIDRFRIEWVEDIKAYYNSALTASQSFSQGEPGRVFLSAQVRESDVASRIIDIKLTPKARAEWS